MEIRDLRNISNSLHELGAVIQKHDPHYHRTSRKAYTLLASSVHTRYKTVVTKFLRNEKSLGLSRNPPPSVRRPAVKTHHEPRDQIYNLAAYTQPIFPSTPRSDMWPIPSLFPTLYLCAFLTSSLSSKCFLLNVVCLNI